MCNAHATRERERKARHTDLRRRARREADRALVKLCGHVDREGSDMLVRALSAAHEQRAKRFKRFAAQLLQPRRADARRELAERLYTARSGLVRPV